jgi:hypothetical protein
MRRLALCLLVLGCVQAPLRSQSPQNWIELQSDHFLLRTDLPEERARKNLDDMEQVRAALLSIHWAKAREPKGRLLVIQVADRKELQEFAKKDFEGFVTYNAFREQILVVHASEDVFDDTLFKHELTHILSDSLGKPKWLSEGLACYLETIQIKRGRGEAVLGKPDSNRLIYLQEWAPPSTWFSIINGGSEVYQDAVYGYGFETESFALVHYLIDRQPRALDQYLTELGQGANYWKAFTDAFPELHEAEISAAMKEYRATLHLGRERRDTVVVKGWTGPIVARTVPPAEALALRADLLRVGPGRPAPQAVESEIARALAVDPGNPYALMLEEKADPKPAVAAHPDDWRAWVLAFDRGGQKRADIEQAAKLAPDEPDVLERLVVAELHDNQSQAALDHATAARDAAPTRTDILEVLAEAYFVNGRCDDAIGTEQRAIDVRPDAGVRQAPAAMRSRMMYLRAHCRNALPPAPAVAAASANSRWDAAQGAPEVNLKSCSMKPPRLALTTDLRIDFTLDVKGRPKAVTVQGEVDKAIRVSLRKFVESCRYEPVVVDGKPREVPTSMVVSSSKKK